MARIARVVVPGIPHHVTQRGVRNMDVFFTPDDREVYKTLLLEQSKRFGIDIVSYCLMSNHVHLIVIPSTETSLAKAIGETHRLYTRKINFRQKARGYLFQGRFFSTPLDERHFFAAMKYVAQNPVRAKMVQHPWEYPYSSAAHHLGQSEDKLITYCPLLDAITDWKDFLDDSAKQVDEIRQKTRTGRPCGNREFYTAIKESSGRDLLPKKAGRHKK
ncbi:MAG: transposase [Campylobacterota bacterium]|nr:transposase [Campylobacterota bacterium]